jgi:hypothetical protein
MYLSASIPCTRITAILRDPFCPYTNNLTYHITSCHVRLNCETSSPAAAGSPKLRRRPNAIAPIAEI